MAVLTPQVVQIAGTTAVDNPASAGGDVVPAGDRAWLNVKNGSGAAVTVTLTTPGSVGGLAIADAVVSVPAAGSKLIGPLTASLFGDPVAISYSATASVTVAALTV